MKPILSILIGSVCLLFTVTSCGSVSLGTTSTTITNNAQYSDTPLTETEISSLTCRVYQMGYDELYHQLLSKLQTNGCYVSGSDKAAGLITAKIIKREQNTHDNCQYLSILITPCDDGKTEIKLTIYVDLLSRTTSVNINIPTIYTVEQKGMLREKSVYDAWFNTLLSPLLLLTK